MHQMKPFPFPMALIFSMVQAGLKATPKELESPRCFLSTSVQVCVGKGISLIHTPTPTPTPHAIPAAAPWTSASYPLKSPAFCKGHQSESNRMEALFLLKTAHLWGLHFQDNL